MLNLTLTEGEFKSKERIKYKDSYAKKVFKKETTETNKLSEIKGNQKPIQVVTKKILKRLKGFVLKSFKMVRIVKNLMKFLKNFIQKKNPKK